MGRALVAIVLAVPVLAVGQIPPVGTVLFTEGTSDLIHGRWINLAECQSGTATVFLSWNTAVDAGQVFPAGVTYGVYASNAQSTGVLCFTQGNGTDVTAGPVGATLVGQPQLVTPQPFPVDAFVTAAGLTCNVTADVPIHVCVQAYAPDGAPVGCARGTLTLSVASPAAPTNVAVAPMDGALGISWTAPSEAPPAYDYRIVASADPAADPYVHSVTTGRVGAVVGVSLTGLVNGATYDVEIYSRSQAGNESAPSAVVRGTPVASSGTVPRLPRPRGDGSGGCATGAAAPVALLGVAALLARVRRRPRGR